MADLMSDAGAQSFGARMAAKRRAGEIPEPPRPGRKPIAEKYRIQIGATERAFATAMPDEARRYVTELAAQDPESCPDHGVVLRCPVPDCGNISQRVPYNHKAAMYVFDRIMGKPTVRAENAVTVRFVEQVTTAFIAVFEDVNGLDDPSDRRQTFGERCLALAAQFGGAAF